MKRLLILLLLLAAPVSAQTLTPSPQSLTTQFSSTCTSTSCATWALTGVPTTFAAVTISVTGTFTGTLTFEGSVDGQTYVTISVTNLADGSSATTTTTAGQFAVGNSGFQFVRVKATALSAGGPNLWAVRGGGVPKGLSPFLTRLYTGDGTCPLPAWSFASDTDLGVYRVSANKLAICAGSELYLHWNGGSGGDGNFAAGYRAGAALAGTGYGNVYIGPNAGRNANADEPNGHANTVVGYGGFEAGTTGSYNTIGGAAAGGQLTTQTGNSFFGYHAGGNVKSADNTFVGQLTGRGHATLATGGLNVAVGVESMKDYTTATLSACVGNGACEIVSSGANNTALGALAGRAITTTSGLVALGFSAGRYETAADKFFVNNRNRTNESGDRTLSLLYGVFADTAAAQTLTVNAALVSSVSAASPIYQGTGTGVSVANVGANSCGTSPATIAGNQNSGVITVGATAGTQCRVTFSTAAPVARDCTVTDSTTTIATRATAVSVTTHDFLGAFVAGDLVTYVCLVR
jgi:hypothetical protein